MTIIDPNILHCANSDQAAAVNAVLQERNYQDKKWGTIQERPREVGTYLTLMRALLSNAEQAFAKSVGDELALAELRKVVAVGIACFEQHGVPTREDKQ